MSNGHAVVNHTVRFLIAPEQSLIALLDTLLGDALLIAFLIALLGRQIPIREHLLDDPIRLLLHS